MLGTHPAAGRHFYDPETDAPAAGHQQLLASTSTSWELFLIAFVLPLLLGLAINLATAFLSTAKPKTAGAQAPSRRVPPQHQHSRSPPPLQTYQQLQQQQQQQSAWHAYAMDPPAASPQTERPFRRTKAVRPPSPQSERPFRVTQSQRVYSTPGSQERPHSTPDAATTGAAAAAGPSSSHHTPLSGGSSRPFRVSRTTPRTAPGPQPSSSPTGRAPAASPPSQPTDAPFRFRSDEELQHHLPNGTPSHPVPSANGTPLLFTSPAALGVQQQQGRSPSRTPASQGPSPQQRQQGSGSGWRQQRVQVQQQRRSPIWGMPLQDTLASDSEASDGDEPGAQDNNTQEPTGWDQGLLRSSAQQERFISSLEGLQQSSAYRKHVNQARRGNLTLEVKEKHKLDVYKALRRVDPESFRQLFSRRDVLEYDEVPLTRPLAVLECLLASALTFALLGLPLWLLAWRPYQQLFAVLWALQQLWVVLAFGCTSLFARMLSIYPTQGQFSMQPTCWRLFAAAALDALLVALLNVPGLLASLSCRLLTEQHQSCGERLLRLQPMREVVRPMHFSPYSPVPVGDALDICTDDEDDA